MVIEIAIGTALGLVLGSALLLIVASSTTVQKWYIKYFTKTMNNLVETIESESY